MSEDHYLGFERVEVSGKFAPLTTAAAREIAEWAEAWLLERAGKGKAYNLLASDDAFVVVAGKEPKDGRVLGPSDRRDW